MEVKSGYKLTEAGLIPTEWEVKRVSDVCGFIVPGRNKPRVFDGDIPWITTPDLLGSRYVCESRLSLFISLSAAKEVGSKVVPAGSVLMSCVGDVGMTAIAARDIVINQQLHAFLPSPIITSEYLNYAIKAKKPYVLGIATKTALPYLNKDNCNSIPILIPPKREQAAIAEALTDADALIESLEQLIDKKRAVKQGAMQELLTGKRRLPGFNEQWVSKTLISIADIRSGGTPSTTQAEYWDGDIPWCTPTDITGLKGSKYLGQTAREITTLGLKSSSAELLPARSIVMTSRATIGECAINLVPVSTNQGFKNFIPLPGTDVEFLYYLLQTKKQDFIGLCGGSTFLEIGKAQLTSFIVKVPEQREQVAISEILSDLDTELDALITKLDKARQIKQGMMQELLTGRIRLV